MRAGYEKVRAAGEAVPGASIDGVLVTPMRSGGAELLAGVTVDPTFGPVLAVGLGGIWVEILNDTSLRVLPVDAAEVKRMLGELRGLPLLQGARGTEPANLDAVAEAIARLGGARPLAGRRAARAGGQPAMGERRSGRGARRPRGHRPGRPIRNGASHMILGVSAEQDELRASVRRFLADRAPLTRVRELMETEDGIGPGRLGAGGRSARPAGPGHPARATGAPASPSPSRRSCSRSSAPRCTAARTWPAPCWPPRRCWPARTRAPGASCCPRSRPARPSPRWPSPRTTGPGTRARSGCPPSRTARTGGWTGTRASCSTAGRPG